jgi:hypothetical protein
MLFWNSGANVVWFDSLVVVYTASNSASGARDAPLLHWAPEASSRLFVTKSAFHGDPDVSTAGIYVSQAPLYMAGAALERVACVSTMMRPQLTAVVHTASSMYLCSAAHMAAHRASSLVRQLACS